MTDLSKNAKAFVDMVARIHAMNEAEFAGAVVIMPPTGEPIAFLLADPAKDEAAFWGLVVSKAEIARQQATESKQNPGGFPRGMR